MRDSELIGGPSTSTLTGDPGAKKLTGPGMRQLDREAARYAIRRTFHGFVVHRGLDSAAALTFFMTLSLFPAILAFASGFGLIDNKERALDSILDVVQRFAPEATVDQVKIIVEELLRAPNPTLALMAGLALTIWTVSGYALAFGRAVNNVYETQEGRRYLKLRALMLIMAVVLIACAALMAAILLITPSVADAVVASLGWPPLVGDLWSWLKWLLLAALAVFTVGLLHYGTPNLHRPRIRWLSYGAVFTIVVWALVTAGYAFYVVNFSSYDRLYGFLGGAIITLIWLYITNFVLVLGVEVDAELLRVRQLLGGVEAESSIAIPVRDSFRNAILAERRTRDEREGRDLRERAAHARKQSDPAV